MSWFRVPVAAAWLALAAAVTADRVAVSQAPEKAPSLPSIVEVRGDGLLVAIGDGHVRSYVLEGANLVPRGDLPPTDGSDQRPHCTADCGGAVSSSEVGSALDPSPPIAWLERGAVTREPVVGRGVGRGGQATVLAADDRANAVIVRDDLRGGRALELRSASTTQSVPVEGAGARVVASPKADIVVVETGRAEAGIGLPTNPKTRVLVRRDSGWQVTDSPLAGLSAACVGDDGTAVVAGRGRLALVRIVDREVLVDNVPAPRGLSPSFGCAAAGGRAVVAHLGGPDTLTLDGPRFPVERWTLDLVGWPPRPTQTVEARNLQVDPTLARFAFVDGANDVTVVNLETGARRVVADHAASIGFLAGGALAVVDERGAVSAHLPEVLP
ncbi:MAG: hypothetical protein QOF60_3485 [Actinomycetota bacterium]|nr:hypothetical protein [Actinomycetota bacterium]